METALRHVPSDIADYYRAALAQNVSQNNHYSYVKWLRYYLDFCAKYRFTEYEPDSFGHFSEKLLSKGQSVHNVEEGISSYSTFVALLQKWDKRW